MGNAVYWLVFLIFLPTILDALGLDGLLEPVREILRAEIERYADEVRVDALGNLIAFKAGSGEDPVVQLQFVDCPPT